MYVRNPGNEKGINGNRYRIYAKKRNLQGNMFHQKYRREMNKDKTSDFRASITHQEEQ